MYLISLNTNDGSDCKFHFWTLIELKRDTTNRKKFGINLLAEIMCQRHANLTFNTRLKIADNKLHLAKHNQKFNRTDPVRKKFCNIKQGNR